MTAESTDEFVPATQTELGRFIRENAAQAALPLYPVGGRTALNFGYPPTDPGRTIALSRLTQTVDYPARDMTITVEAGVRIADLNALLLAEKQRLAVDIAQAHRATLGGAIATNTSGPRRFGLGTLRDYVIGISAIDAGGKLFKAGGRVVKNVAGYDLCKLLIGSLGTIGVITQVTLKLRPIPEATAWLWVNFAKFADVEPVLSRLLTSASRPVAIEALDPRAAAEIAAAARISVAADQPVLCLAVEGTARDVAWQVDTLKQELAPFQPRQLAVVSGASADELTLALTEYQTSSEEPVTFQAHLLPSQTVEFLARAQTLGISLQAHAGNGTVIGHLPDEVTTAAAAAEMLTPLRQFARQNKGNLVILNCDNAWKQVLPVFGDPEPAWPLMRRLRQELDPRELLNRGRFGSAGP
jgi:glycolate oxidase FAD binding subunit